MEAIMPSRSTSVHKKRHAPPGDDLAAALRVLARMPVSHRDAAVAGLSLRGLLAIQKAVGKRLPRVVCPTMKFRSRRIPLYTADPDEGTPIGGMTFGLALVRRFGLNANQVDAVIARFDRRFPGLRVCQPQRFYATVLRDFRKEDALPLADAEENKRALFERFGIEA
jgi:hypothetical protein